MMFLKELKKILDFKKSDKDFRYCFYVENNNIFHYLKKYIYKKSDKFKVLLFTNEDIFYKKNKNVVTCLSCLSNMSCILQYLHSS